VHSSSKVISNAITAGYSAVRKLRRVILWGNLRLVCMQTLGGYSAHSAMRRRVQLFLQDWRQWHGVYAISPTERNGAHTFIEPAGSVHPLPEVQHMRPWRSVHVQCPHPWFEPSCS